MKKIVLLSLLISLLFTAVIPWLFGIIYETATKSYDTATTNLPQVGDRPPLPEWSYGLPFPFRYFEDCPSGCISQFSFLALFVDISFWFIVAFLFFRFLKRPRTR